MPDFDPYIQITPTQQIADPFNPLVGSKSAGVSRPAENWGKILGGLAPALTKVYGIKEDEEKVKQEAEARAIIADEESSAIAERLHEYSKTGEIPPGYSQHLIKLLNTQLARKAFTEFEGTMDRELVNFNNPDYEESPLALLETTQASILEEKYKGLYGTAEFRNTFDNLKDQHNASWAKSAHLARSGANLRQAGDNLSDDFDTVIDSFVVGRSGGRPTIERLNTEVNTLMKEAAEAGAADGYALSQGTLSKTLLARVMAASKTLKKEKDWEGAEELLEAYATLNPKTALNIKPSATEPADWDLKGSVAYDHRVAIQAELADIRDKRTLDEGSNSSKVAQNLQSTGRALSEMAQSYMPWVEWLADPAQKDVGRKEVVDHLTEMLTSADFATWLTEDGKKLIEYGTLDIRYAVTQMADAASEQQNQALADEITPRAEAVDDHNVEELVAPAIEILAGEVSVPDAEAAVASTKINLEDATAAEGGSLSETPAGKLALAKLGTAARAAAARAEAAGKSSESILFVGAGSEMNSLVARAMSTAKKQLGKTDPAFVRRTDPKEMPEEVEVYIETELAGLYRAELELVVSEAVRSAESNSKADMDAAMSSSLERHRPALKEITDAFTIRLESAQRDAADKLAERIRGMDTLPVRTSEVGGAAEWMTGFSSAQANEPIRNAVSLYPEEPGRLMGHIWGSDHFGEIMPYLTFYTDTAEAIRKAGSAGYEALVIDDGRIIHKDSLTGAWEGFWGTDWTQETADVIHTTMDQFRAIGHWDADVQRKWTIVGKGMKKPRYVDRETKLDIDPKLLNPKFYPVVSSAVIVKYGPDSTVNTKFREEWAKATIEGAEDYERQAELLEVWVAPSPSPSSSAMGRVYANLPPEYQGDPVEYLDDQAELWKDWNNNALKEKATDANIFGTRNYDND